MRFLVFLLLAVSAWAQPWSTHGLTIPEAHPRLWWTPDRITAGQAWLAANPFTPVQCAGTANAGCVDIALKHVLSGSSCQVAIDYLNRSYCNGTDCLSTSAGSDYARQNGEMLHTIYDWCHDSLTTSDVSTTSSAVSTPTVNTTVTSTSSNTTGVRTVTPASMTGISIGTKLVIRPSVAGEVEMVTVTATTATTFTASFGKAFHGAGSQIVNAQTITPTSMTGIYLWQPLTVGGEVVWVMEVTGSTYTAGFTASHSGGATTTGPSMISFFTSRWNLWMAGVNAQTYGNANTTAVQNNYFQGQLRNNWNYSIATYGENGDNSYPEGFLDNGLTRTTNYVAASPDMQGGIALEGPGYGVSITSYPLIAMQSASNLGLALFGSTDLFKQSVYGLIYATTPSPTYNKQSGNAAFILFPFSDDAFDGGGVATVLSGRNYYQTFTNWASNQYSATNVGKYARLWYNTVQADAATAAPDRFVLAVDANPSAMSSYSALPLDFYAKSLRYLYGRKAWDTTSTAFHWQMGSGRNTYGGGLGNHGHQDFGNFNIWRGGRWLTRESAGYTLSFQGYGLRTLGSGKVTSESMLAHNTVTFGTPLQSNDLGLMPTSLKGNGVVTRLETTGAYAYAAANLTDQYLWDASHSSYDRGAVVRVEREFLFIRSLETTIVFDRITAGAVTKGVDAGLAAADQVNTFNIHFETNPTLEDAAHITATNGTQVLRMTTLIPASPTRRVIDETDCSGLTPAATCSNRGQYRVEIDNTGAVQRYFLHVLQARGTSDANITASVVDSNPGSTTAGTLTVTLHPATGSDTTIVFNKGQTSSGGTVNVAGAGAVSLYSGVQDISYTDNGPVWGTAAPGTYAIAQGSLAIGTTGSTYSQTLTMINGTGPHTFAVTTGTLPDGLSISSGGTISGTPTVVGVYPITITATDTGNGNATATRDLSITVLAPVRPNVAVKGVAIRGAAVK